MIPVGLACYQGVVVSISKIKSGELVTSGAGARVFV